MNPVDKVVVIGCGNAALYAAIAAREAGAAVLVLASDAGPGASSVLHATPASGMTARCRGVALGVRTDKKFVDEGTIVIQQAILRRLATTRDQARTLRHCYRVSRAFQTGRITIEQAGVALNGPTEPRGARIEPASVARRGLAPHR